MVTGLRDEEIRKDVYDAMQSGKPPFAAYRKAVLGRVLVKFLDPIRMVPDEIVLKGNPEDPDEIDAQVIKVWSAAEDTYIHRNNKRHFEDGSLVAYTPDEEIKVSINQITDDEIELVLQKPFFALQNKLNEFTSTVPVRRFLTMAEKMNRPVGTVNYIKSVLEKMETD